MIKLYILPSDMPETFGQSDLFKVLLPGDVPIQHPENLGIKINTEGRETFLFSDENELYFASDGRPDLGGLDIYVAKIEDKQVLMKCKI
jgi:hypothetical protein